MTASLQTKTSRPNYYVVLSYKDETTGKNKIKWISTDIPIKGNTKRKAEGKRLEVLAEYEKKITENVDLSKDVLFTVFMKEWLENMKHSIASTTYDAYKINVDKRIVPFFESKKLKVKDITPAHIQQYVNHQLKNVSANTVRKQLANISKCLDSAVKQNLIAFNPVKRIAMPKKVRYTGAKHYNEKEIEKLLECSKGDPLEIPILLTVFYGLRRSEVLGLRWDAVDLDNNSITIKHTVTQVDKIIHRKDTTKNDSSYAILPLPNIIKYHLKRWKLQQTQNRWLQPNDYIDEGYICTQVDGSLMKPNYITQHFKILLEKNDMPRIRYHDIRHSSANYLKYLGFDLKDIQTWLRHGDIQTTMNIYMNLDMDAKWNIADRLNDKFKNFG